MTIPFIDSHAHLNLMPPDSPPDQTLERARRSGLVALVNVGTDLDRSRESIQLSETLPGVFATVGLHPGDADQWSPEIGREFLSMACRERVVAIGETGLDFSYDAPSRDIQEFSFEKHVHLAQERNLPLVIHCRDAFERVFSILKTHSLPSRPGVFHCFTGSWDEARKALDLGFYLSFSGIVTFKNAEYLRDVSRRAPSDRMLVETDCPYLAPVPFRGKTNEPAYLPETIGVIAHERQEKPGTLSETLIANTRTLFALPKSA